MTRVIEEKDRFRIVTTCLIHDARGKFLVTKRASTLAVYPGRWTVPGGGIEEKDWRFHPQTSPDGWDEIAQGALRREIREEVGLEVGYFEIIGNTIFIRPDGIPVFVLRFCAAALHTNVVLDPKDSTEYAWILSREVENYDLLGNIPSDIRRMDALFGR